MTRTGEILSTSLTSPQKPVALLASPKAPSIFEYTDYRAFLRDFYLHKQASMKSYSMSLFIRRAGLGANSRGYLKLIMDGKRNLTPHSVRRFSDALGLGAREALYFENLVFFNQAKNSKDQEFYFQRLGLSLGNQTSKQFEVLRSQYEYYSNWYLVAIRELVGTIQFKEDPAWIVTQLRNKISKKQALTAIEHLLHLGLVLRKKNGQLTQASPLVKWTGGVFNQVIQKFHTDMIDRAKESLTEDSYEERNASSLTLSCNAICLPEIKKEIDRFRDEMNLKFGQDPRPADSVLQVNFQLFQLTPAKRVLPKGESHEPT